MRDAGRGGEGGNASTDMKKGSSSNTKHSSDAGTTQRHNDDEDAGMHMPSDSTHMTDDDAGTNLPDTENCCVAHAKPGCNDADIQQCVCDKLDACCTQAWTAACTYIVTERYCQPGVRDCVCGSGDGQWQQSTCCDADWTSTCDDVAQIKCGASVGCK